MKKFILLFAILFGLELIIFAAYFKNQAGTKRPFLAKPGGALTPQGIPSFFLSPDSGEFPSNQNFTVQVMLSTAGKSIIGADALLQYEPQKLEVLAILPGDIFTVYPQQKVAAGKILVSGITQNKEGFFGQGTLVKLNLRGKTAGETRLAFTFTPGRSDDSNLAEAGTNKDVLEKVKSGVYTFK